MQDESNKVHLIETEVDTFARHPFFVQNRPTEIPTARTHDPHAPPAPRRPRLPRSSLTVGLVNMPNEERARPRLSRPPPARPRAPPLFLAQKTFVVYSKKGGQIKTKNLFLGRPACIVIFCCFLFFCVKLYIGTPPHMIKTACAKFREQNHPNITFLLIL